MALLTTGSIAVDADRATAFAFIQDPHRLAHCIPGCRELRQRGPDRYTAVLASRVAMITVSFAVTIEVVRIDPPRAIDATITGDGVGLAGHLVASAGIELIEDDPKHTTIRYRTEVGLTGKLGGLGQPVFRATSDRLAREFATNLKRDIEAAAHAGPTA
jgi:uncharacterized protein